MELRRRVVQLGAVAPATELEPAEPRGAQVPRRSAAGLRVQQLPAAERAAEAVRAALPEPQAVVE